MEYKNTTKIPQAILKECVIEPGGAGEISDNAAQNPGVKSRIEDKLLVPIKATKPKPNKGA